MRRTATASAAHERDLAGMLRDPQIARALSAMAAEPGGRHTIGSLARLAALSRSAFYVRFRNAVGKTPMSLLRELRMRDAATQFEATQQSVEQVANSVGYSSRSSFVRAFLGVHGTSPSAYRPTETDPDGSRKSGGRRRLA
jgi:AraC-like DNA-binding protein